MLKNSQKLKKNCTHYFQKVKNEHFQDRFFFYAPLGTGGKDVLQFSYPLRSSLN